MSIEYRPKSGVGRFKAKLNANSLEIKHRISIVGSLNSPPTNTQIILFQQDFQNLITQHWDGKYTFKRGTQTVTPTFRLKFLAATEQLHAHYVMNLADSAGGSESIGRDAYYKHKALGDNAPRTSNLFTGSTNQPDSVKLTATDLPKWLPYYVDFVAGNLSPTTMAQTKLLMKQIALLNPQPRLYVTAYGTNANTNQTTIVNLMQACGLNNVSRRNSSKGYIPKYWGHTSTSKMSGGADYVKISNKGTINTQSILNKSNLYSYPATVVHEYGHMLGLQDEYNCLSQLAANQMVQLNMIDVSEQKKYEQFHYKGATSPSDRVAEGQRKIIKYCHKAGVEPQHFGRHTTSLMSAGSDILPCHFIWVWAALCELTNQDDWTIQ